MRALTILLLIVFCSMTAGSVAADTLDDLFQSGQFDAAGKLAQQELSHNPNDAHAALTAGRVALLENRWDDARRCLSKAAQLDPNDDKPKLLLAECYRRRDQFTQAALQLRAAGRAGRADALDLLRGKRPYDIEGSEEIAYLKFTQVDPLPVVRVRVNGGSDVYFLIDTGGAEVILDPVFAKERKIGVTGSDAGTFGGGKTGSYQFAKLDSLQLGSFTVRNVPVTVLPTRPFSIVNGGKPIDGIIGTVLLYHFLSTIDYPNGQLILRRRSDLNRQIFLQDAASQKAVSIPFWLAGDHAMAAWGRANDSDPQLFLIDTGMAGGGFTAPESTMRLAGIVPAGSAQQALGGGGNYEDRAITVARLSLGSIEEKNVAGSATAFPPSLETSLGFHLGGLISHQFFRPYEVTFDFDGMQIFLVKD